ncbi:hypothetical protein [Streptomyces lateritius]|uniref:hypothetical protein n=1 Tax=Streptomyces lateritius TaxID=67313 RepID=UPI001C8BD183|nr:hypothetical protein [Streptomyces lateritius]MBX9425456.1 hypothetical protein [Streptomyces lateritius]
MNVTDAETPEARLGRLVHARRMELDLPLRAAAESAEIAVNTLRRVEAGLPVRGASYAKVDRALSWAPGSSMAILGGATGPVTITPSPAGEGYVLAQLPDDDFKGVVTNAVVAVADGLTAREIRDISERVLADLKAKGYLGDD